MSVSLKLSPFKKPKRSHIVNCVSTSNSEPIAIYKNLLNSISLLRLQPSAIFEGIEIEALVI